MHADPSPMEPSQNITKTPLQTTAQLMRRPRIIAQRHSAQRASRTLGNGRCIARPLIDQRRAIGAAIRGVQQHDARAQASAARAARRSARREIRPRRDEAVDWWVAQWVRNGWCSVETMGETSESNQRNQQMATMTTSGVAVSHHAVTPAPGKRTRSVSLASELRSPRASRTRPRRESTIFAHALAATTATRSRRTGRTPHGRRSVRSGAAARSAAVLTVVELPRQWCRCRVVGSGSAVTAGVGRRPRARDVECARHAECAWPRQRPAAGRRVRMGRRRRH